MWHLQSVTHMTLTISGKCDTYKQRFSMAIHRHYCIHLCRRLNFFCWGRHLPLIASFTFITDCQCHIYHRLSVLHLPLNISVTFTTEYQCHIYHWMPVSHLQSITQALLHTFMPSIKLFLLRKIILLSIRIQLLQVGSNKTLLEKLPWRQHI
jgi:hypothetical protein